MSHTESIFWQQATFKHVLSEQNNIYVYSLETLKSVKQLHNSTWLQHIEI